jgi:hypothetical protein
VDQRLRSDYTAHCMSSFDSWAPSGLGAEVCLPPLSMRFTRRYLVRPSFSIAWPSSSTAEAAPCQQTPTVISILTRTGGTFGGQWNIQDGAHDLLKAYLGRDEGEVGGPDLVLGQGDLSDVRHPLRPKAP